MPCSTCDRKFSPDRIDRHSNICSNNAKRVGGKNMIKKAPRPSAYDHKPEPPEDWAPVAPMAREPYPVSGLGPMIREPNAVSVEYVTEPSGRHLGSGLAAPPLSSGYKAVPMGPLYSAGPVQTFMAPSLHAGMGGQALSEELFAARQIPPFGGLAHSGLRGRAYSDVSDGINVVGMRQGGPRGPPVHYTFQ